MTSQVNDSVIAIQGGACLIALNVLARINE